jgi:hypothetical protein
MEQVQAIGEWRHRDREVWEEREEKSETDWSKVGWGEGGGRGGKRTCWDRPFTADCTLSFDVWYQPRHSSTTPTMMVHHTLKPMNLFEKPRTDLTTPVIDKRPTAATISSPAHMPSTRDECTLLHEQCETNVQCHMNALPTVTCAMRANAVCHRGQGEQTCRR